MVHVLKDRASVEREHPGLLSLFLIGLTHCVLLPLVFICLFLNKTEIWFSFIPRVMPAPTSSHNVCTEFLLPTIGPGACHQMWHPGNPFHADQQQLCTDQAGLVRSLYIWIHAA